MHKECKFYLIRLPQFCLNSHKRQTHPETGRRQSNGTRTGKTDTGGQTGGCAAPPESQLLLSPEENGFNSGTSALIQTGVTSSKSFPYLFTEVGPFQGNHADVNCVSNKSLVVHELVRGEGGDGVQEKLCSLLEVPDGHAVETLVHLQTVPPVPVSPLLDEAAQGTNNSHASQMAFKMLQSEGEGRTSWLFQSCE